MNRILHEQLESLTSNDRGKQEQTVLNLWYLAEKFAGHPGTFDCAVDEEILNVHLEDTNVLEALERLEKLAIQTSDETFLISLLTIIGSIKTRESCLLLCKICLRNSNPGIVSYCIELLLQSLSQKSNFSEAVIKQLTPVFTHATGKADQAILNRLTNLMVKLPFVIV